MNLHERVRWLFCPSCIEMEAGDARRERTVSILERSGESLDRIAEELRAIAQRMARDRNPVLGERTRQSNHTVRPR